jgi:serine/threonine protein kinase
MKHIYKILGILSLFILLAGVHAIEPEWKYKTGGYVKSVAISSDGDYVVAGSEDNCYGYDYFSDKNGNLLWKYKTGNIVDSVAITPDGKYVVVGSWDRNVYFFDNKKISTVNKVVTTAENKISLLKSNNLSTTEPENLLKQAKQEFDKRNFTKSYDLANLSIKKADEILNNYISTHINPKLNETTNLINSLKSIINTSEYEEKLNKAKELINSKKYRKAENVLDGLIKELKQIKNAHLKINELKSLINKLDGLGVDTAELKTSLSNAEDNFKKKNYQSALKIANFSLTIANQALTSKQEMNKAKNLINQEKSKGRVVVDAEDLLNKAELEFQNKNYKKSENLANQSISKILYIKEVADLAKLKIDEANQSISRAKFLKFIGLNTKESELLLSQSVKQYSIGNYEESKKLAEQSKSKADGLLFTSLKFGGGILLTILFIGIVITKGKSFFTRTPTVPEFPKQLSKKYIPLQKIGEGGFAKVFKVKRKSDKKIIALKISNLARENIGKFFKKEVEAWKNLNHKNIVKMFNASEKPIPHIEMEYVDGYNLNGKLIRNLDEYPKPLNELEAINTIKQIAEGLKHAHDKNITHRDLKPSNILLTKDKTPKITDWGLAKIGDKSSTTTRGFTLAYAPPEVLRDEKTDNRTDIYQLGVIFYELLTGKLSYDALTEGAMINKILDENIKPTPISKINPNLAKYDTLFEKLLAKNKEDRFQSIDEVIKILDEIEKSSKIREEIKKSLTLTTKLSKEDKELIYLAVNKLIDYALINAKLDDKAELLNTLNELKYTYYNKEDLKNLISQIEYMLKNDISITEKTTNQLSIILNKIKSEILQKLNEERDKLKASFNNTKTKLTTIKNKSEKKKLIYSAVSTLTKYALISAELNNIDDALMALEELLLFVKNKENKKELKGAIGHLKYIRENNIPISEKVKHSLYVVLENVKREVF